MIKIEHNNFRNKFEKLRSADEQFHGQCKNKLNELRTNIQQNYEGSVFATLQLRFIREMTSITFRHR